jgi:outer membrane protein assembly factor BamA
MKVLLAILIASFLLPLAAYSQDKISKNFQQEDLKDWLVRHKISKPKPPKDNFLLIIPIVAATPSAGFMIGAGLTYAFKLQPQYKKVSTASANATYSTKGLLNLNAKTNVFILGERLVLNGDWRYMINNETTYGLGTRKYTDDYIDINGYQTSSDSLGVPMKYHQIRIHEIGSWLLAKNFYAGIGVHYDYYFGISDQALAEGDTGRSYQYEYSIQHGFNPTHYTATGISLNFLYDSRDNQVNAYRGMYANVNFRANSTALGSSEDGTLLLTEYRAYIPLDGARQRHILAFWYYGNFALTGNTPYLLLPALGYDQRQRTGRGYTFGRFRGEDMMYGETEYRFPVSVNTGILGGVLFANCTTTSDKRDNVYLFNYMRLGYGGGLRIMMDKQTRTRLEVDAGVGGKAVGLYLGAQETF